MTFPDLKFIELAKGLTNRNEIFSLENLWEHLSNAGIGTNTSLVNFHVGIHRFGRDFRDHVRKNNSVSGFEGEHICDFAFFEKDGQGNDDREILRNAVAALFYDLDILENWGIDSKNIIIDVSGRRSFHVEIPAGLFQPRPHKKCAEIHKTFVQKLGLKGVDVQIYKSTHLIRLRGSFNAPKEGMDACLRGFKVYLNGSLQSLKDDPFVIYDIWKNPTTDCLTREFITREWYWKQKPVEKLIDLWGQCEREIDQSVKINYFRPSHSGVSRSKNSYQYPACISNLIAAMEKGDLNGRSRNEAVFHLTLFLKHKLGMPDDMARGAVIGAAGKLITPAGQVDSFTQEEILTAMNSALAGGYGVSCGTGRESYLSSFCSEQAGACPEFLKKQTVSNGRIVTLSDAFLGMQKLHRESVEYILGIPEFDRMTFLRRKKSIFIIAAPSIGKTQLLLSMIEQNARIAKSRQEKILVITPEEDPAEAVESLLVSRGQYRFQELFDVARNGQSYKKEVCEWLGEYGDTVLFASITRFSAGELEEIVVEARKNNSITVMVFDGVSFIKTDSANSGGLVIELSQIIARQGLIGFFSVHVPKGKDQSSEEFLSKRPGMQGGMGSMHFGNVGFLVLSMWVEDGVVKIALEKAKRRKENDVRLPEPITRLRDAFYRLWAPADARKIWRENRSEFDRLFLPETEAHLNDDLETQQRVPFNRDFAEVEV